MTDPDAGLADRIAAQLRTERQAELGRAAMPKPPPAPDWLFGPRHKELDRARREAAEAARHELPALAEPEVPAALRCPCCLQPMPAGEP